MKATELRIGNWVDQPNEGVTKVTSILNDLQIKTETGYVDKYCRAIPLTEEWLLKFGFEKQIDDYYYFYGYYASFDADLPMWFGQEGCCQKETIKDNIKHVHQLQNLYFALTGEELEIT